MNEDEFEYEGKTYVAVEGSGCELCAMFINYDCSVINAGDSFPQCYSKFSKDKADVHFEEKK
jgi:hypothetical protein